MLNSVRGPVKTVSISELPIWEEAKKDRVLLSFVIELTSRCNNDCVHCYINQAATDTVAKEREITFEEIKRIADEAVALGALWVLLSGGEPLLRPDFEDIYMYLKKKGLLVSVFTNATLISEKHIKLFRKYPPRDIEVTVYGVTDEVYSKVTRKKMFAASMAGIDMLLANKMPVTLKTTVMKSNLEEIERIAEFCRARSSAPFRFDPFLHFRLDGDTDKNNLIEAERLSYSEIAELEKKDTDRLNRLSMKCLDTGTVNTNAINPKKIFRCQAGINSCCIDAEGMLRLCSSLGNKNCIYDLRNGTLTQAWEEFIPEVLRMETESDSFVKTCGECTLHDLCSSCPAYADLETGQMDGHLEYFCTVAKNRKEYFS